MSSEKLELTKAAEYIGFSRRTLWLRTKAGEIAYTTDPLDRRKKLYLVDDLNKLKEGQPNGG